MSKRTVSTPDAPPPGGPYSQAVVAGGLVFLAGQTPKTPAGEAVGGSFADQANQVFDNLEAVARASGASLHDAVRVGVFLRDMGDFAELNRIFVERFGSELPVRTTVPVDL